MNGRPRIAYFSAWCIRDEICHEGRLNMTYLALVLSHYVNGVAKRHGEVSQHMFATHKIDSITNGVHGATWASSSLAQLHDLRIPGWRADNSSFRYALGIPADEIWNAHRAAKRAFIEYANRAANAGFDLDVFTLGFARRSTAYKRPGLLLADLERLRRISTGIGKLQIAYAGKAHPRDEDGKRQIQRVVQVARELAPDVRLCFGIPRGGAVTAAVRAEEIGAEMDVVLACKLRAPDAPEYAIGAISETGEVYFNHAVHQAPGLSDEYVHQECQYQLQEIERRKKMFRAVRPAAPIAGRSVIVTDDGIATGSTMIAALQAIRVQRPLSLVVVVPVASPDRLREVRHWCDNAVCLLTPRFFYAVGQFYEDFEPVSDEEVVQLLHGAAHSPAAMLQQR